MLRVRFAVLFLPLITLCAPALSQDAPATVPAQPIPAEDRISTPKPRDFRMPLYPASEREARNTGYVDVAVLVSVEGQLQEIKSVPSEPRNAAFEEGTKEAVAKWRFAPVPKRCMPVQAEASYRVSFEMADGTDDVRARLLLSPLQIADSRREMTAPNKNDMLRTLKYPQQARRAGAQGSVYLLLNVNPANGIIDSIDVASATSDKPGFESSFADVSVEPARKFIFTPMPELKARHRICVPFVFCVRVGGGRTGVKNEVVGLGQYIGENNSH